MHCKYSCQYSSISMPLQKVINANKRSLQLSSTTIWSGKPNPKTRMWALYGTFLCFDQTKPKQLWLWLCQPRLIAKLCKWNLSITMDCNTITECPVLPIFRPASRQVTAAVSLIIGTVMWCQTLPGITLNQILLCNSTLSLSFDNQFQITGYFNIVT